VPPAVALSNYISSGILWRIFCRTGIFAGFSLRMYHLHRWGSSAAVMAGYILFFSLAGPVGDKTGHTVIFLEVFSLYYSPEGRTKLRWASLGEGRGHCIFKGAE
jgi:hypothetical protein